MSCQQHHNETVFAQIGNQKQESLKAISTPIYLSTSYRHNEIGHGHGYDYTRTGNPTRDVLEEAMAKLESGDKAFATTSGMSAIQLVFSLFASGDHIITCRDVYGGSYRYFEMLEQKQGFQFTYWSGSDERELAEQIKPETKAIFIETPTNPLMTNIDMTAVSRVAKAHNLLFIVDNTVYTPYLQKPIADGADIVIHSATKYLAGHNDVLAGVVVSKGEKLSKELDYIHNSIGSTLSPFDCWLLMRGMKTLPLRMRQHEDNASQVKTYLESQPLVKNVLYPGKGGMLSFLLKDETRVVPFLQALSLFTFAESLGGVESLITYPATQTHAEIPEDVRKSYGLTNELLRLSVGIEHADDLIEDLKQGFAAVE
ncbi:aminotransferase class I/II-fold pyridoxal phosphate-dependent enzyme [Lentibacillus salicampi]|uniref:Aminotransferase class I/II-fold pyridoxal phosphate-dependent enzyme n=1 Tax=Lentibacillus salicampi TaxID=175306 RepID=A0A4Y9AE48_9BACI|nr:aminotransferase class I/II-fold pyridoxal phosphate-dependent enzyme [Lentibacillus salicampi]TFJ94169.1 aminotransferase class I/II-fold pyridoxal phosphate-dependent enzyme [Lentibacillus salicampi]